ncbi:MAG: Hint domain-containing protein [Thiohalomonadaceae bacterium]
MPYYGISIEGSNEVNHGETITVTGILGVTEATYEGYTVDGDPIIKAGGKYYLLTDKGGVPPYVVTQQQQSYTLCFARGTLIATPSGDKAVEDLRIGDLVLTADGQAVPVKWIGRQTRHPLFTELPVRIRTGALGNGLPRRDLYVSPAHALLVDGLLVQAQALVNGATIQQMKEWQGNVEYFHIELENHELVLAEGTPAETFVDNASRRTFDNFAEYLELYGEESPIPELPQPRVKHRRQLPARIQQRLMDIARSGYSQVA